MTRVFSESQNFHSESDLSTQKRFLFVGLGNPGEKYQHTPHNVGRESVKFWAESRQWPEFQLDKYRRGYFTKGVLDSTECLFLLPETYMNRSGEAVQRAVQIDDLKPNQVVLVHDDLDLPLGRLKISSNRGSGGHNGVQSVIKALGTKEVIRLRVGVKIGEATDLGRDYLLNSWSMAKEELIEAVYQPTAEALTEIVAQGLNKAMSKINQVS